jgi:hypothetical protein
MARSWDLVLKWWAEISVPSPLLPSTFREVKPPNNHIRLSPLFSFYLVRFYVLAAANMKTVF